MSTISKRLLDLARANLNALLEKAAEHADPRRRLASLSDAELEAELARRRAAREAQKRIEEMKAQVSRPSERPSAASGAEERARAGGTKTAARDRAERERLAREREEKVRAAREARERAAREARERAEREAREAQARTRARPGGGARAHAGGAAAPRPGSSRDAELAKHYAVLEIPFGSDWETVKAAYRRLMRKYHPDLHAGSPEKLRAATEVSQALTTAYNELEKALLGGPNRTR